MRNVFRIAKSRRAELTDILLQAGFVDFRSISGDKDHILPKRLPSNYPTDGHFPLPVGFFDTFTNAYLTFDIVNLGNPQLTEYQGKLRIILNDFLYQNVFRVPEERVEELRDFLAKSGFERSSGPWMIPAKRPKDYPSSMGVNSPLPVANFPVYFVTPKDHSHIHHINFEFSNTEVHKLRSYHIHLRKVLDCFFDK